LSIVKIVKKISRSERQGTLFDESAQVYNDIIAVILSI